MKQLSNSSAANDIIKDEVNDYVVETLVGLLVWPKDDHFSKYVHIITAVKPPNKMSIVRLAREYWEIKFLCNSSRTPEYNLLFPYPIWLFDEFEPIDKNFNMKEFWAKTNALIDAEDIVATKTNNSI